MLNDEQGEELVNYAHKVLESYVRDEELPKVPERVL